MSSITAPKLVKLIRKRQGRKSNRAFAQEIGMSNQLLSSVYAGESLPGTKLARIMGYRRETSTTYHKEAK